MDKFTYQEEISRFLRERGTPYENMCPSLSLSISLHYHWIQTLLATSFFCTVTETKRFSLCISSVLTMKQDTAHYLFLIHCHWNKTLLTTSLCAHSLKQNTANYLSFSLSLSLSLSALSLKQITAHCLTLCTLTETKHCSLSLSLSCTATEIKHCSLRLSVQTYWNKTLLTSGTNR
jgi:hypothetical protein